MGCCCLQSGCDRGMLDIRRVSRQPRRSRANPTRGECRRVTPRSVGRVRNAWSSTLELLPSRLVTSGDDWPKRFRSWWGGRDADVLTLPMVSTRRRLRGERQRLWVPVILRQTLSEILTQSAAGAPLRLLASVASRTAVSVLPEALPRISAIDSTAKPFERPALSRTHRSESKADTHAHYFRF